MTHNESFVWGVIAGALPLAIILVIVLLVLR